MTVLLSKTLKLNTLHCVPRKRPGLTNDKQIFSPLIGCKRKEAGRFGNRTVVDALKIARHGNAVAVSSQGKTVICFSFT